jgi:hypothetical protein
MSTATIQDEFSTNVRGMAEALLHRVDAQATLTDNGRRFRAMSLLEVGRELLESQGVRTRGMDRMTLAGTLLRRALGTTDFASLMANVASKRLRAAYAENPGTYRTWARRAPNAPDFKPISVVQVSALPDLLQVNEHGEFKYGTLSDGAESYSLLTYGRIAALTRQALVNDDLRAFDRITTGFGAAAARLENRTVYAQLTANAAMSDGTALFHAAHGNLNTGAGSALSASALGVGRQRMRTQVGLQFETLNVMPKFLVVPAALEQTAYQLTSAQYVPATTSAINEFREGGRTAVVPVVETILDGVSSTAWYLAADGNLIDTVEFCHLDGAEGPVIESEPAFSMDAVNFKCRLDFAAKAIDFRGLLRSDGV